MSEKQIPKPSANQWRNMTNSQIDQFFGMSSGWASTNRPPDVTEPAEPAEPIKPKANPPPEAPTMQ